MASFILNTTMRGAKMKVMNFKELKVESAPRYKELSMRLKLEEKLDLNYSVFTEMIFQEISAFIDEQKIENYENAIVFQFQTDLERTDLKFVKDIILAALTAKLIKTKQEWKHNEKRLGIPKGLGGLEIMDGHLMDLVNFPLLTERFQVEFYDLKNRKYKPVVKAV